MKRKYFLAPFVLAALVGCAAPRPPAWAPTSPAAEAEYEVFMGPGTATLAGQAFLRQQGGGVVKAAGRTVTLDPATSTGAEWWAKAARQWVHRDVIPPSAGFARARRATTADAEGRFKFSNVPSGAYFIRTEVTWMVGFDIQGGLLGSAVTLEPNATTEIVLGSLAQ